MRDSHAVTPAIGAYAQALLDATAEAALLMDPSGRVLAANETAARRHGRSVSEMCGATIYDLVPADVAAHRRACVAEAVRTGGVVVSEEVQSGRTIRSLINPLLDETGAISSLAVLGLDVTDQRDAEAALRESEEHFRQVYDQSPVAYHSLDPDGRILEVNDTWLSELGYSRQEAIGRWFGDFLPDDGAELFRERFALLQQRGATHGAEFEVRRKDGECLTVLLGGRAVYDASGAFVRTHCVFTNVTERKRAEEALQRSEARMREVMRHARCVLWTGEIEAQPGWEVDPYALGSLHWRLTFQPDEQAAQNMVPLDLPPGWSYSDAFYASHPEEDQAESNRRGKAAIARGEGGYTQEYRCLDRHGHLHWLREDVSLQPVAPRRWRAFGVCTDVTALKHAEILLRASADLAEAAQHGTLDGLLQMALDRAELLTGSCFGFFHFVDPDQENLTLQTWSSHTLAGMCTAEGKGKHYPVSEAGVWAACVRLGRPVIHNDYAALPHRKGLPEGHVPVTRELVVPIVRDGLVVGIMGVGNKESDYSEEDVRVVEELASVVLDHAIGKRAEDALRQSEERFRMLVENAADGISMSREVGLPQADGSVVRARQLVWGNDRWVEMSGYPREELAACPNLRALVTVNSTPAEQQRAAERRAAGEPYRGVSSWVRPDGRENFYEWVAVPFEREGVRYSFGIDRDVTERAQSERRQRARLAASGILAQVMDRHSAQTAVLRALAEAMGWSVAVLWMEDPAGRGLEIQSRWHEAEPAVAALADALLSAGPGDGERMSASAWRTGELLVADDLSAQGEEWCAAAFEAGLRAAAAVPVREGNHTVGCLFFATRRAGRPSGADLEMAEEVCSQLSQVRQRMAVEEHRDRLNAELRQVNADLKAAQQAVTQQERLRALGQMASGIAHDINNALMPVLTYAELALEREEELTDRQKLYLTRIRTAATDISGTVARMREFYRPRSEQAEWKPVDVDALAAQVVDLTRPRWRDIPQQLGVAIEVYREIAPGLPDVRGDEGELREALTNLIFNAVDAMPEGGTLTIRATSPPSPGGRGRRVALEVSDTGTGMDEATRVRCLEPFFSTKGERGTGLGLAMVYGTVQRHEGQIEISSAPGEGTTVRLLLPAWVAEGSGAPDEAEPVAGHASLRILVVDDEPVILEMMRELLTADGHHATLAEGGEAGITAFAAALESAEPFDVVLTDLGMPRVGGRQVAESVRAASPGTPVVLVTGWGGRLNAEGEIPQGVSEVVSKPLRLADIRRTLARVSARGDR